MPVATTVILMMKMITSGIAALIRMHTYGCCMAVVQLRKYMFAINVKRMRGSLSKNLLQFHAAAHGRQLIAASKGDTSVALLDCCKCR